LTARIENQTIDVLKPANASSPALTSIIYAKKQTVNDSEFTDARSFNNGEVTITKRIFWSIS